MKSAAENMFLKITLNALSTWKGIGELSDQFLYETINQSGKNESSKLVHFAMRAFLLLRIPLPEDQG